MAKEFLHISQREPGKSLGTGRSHGAEITEKQAREARLLYDDLPPVLIISLTSKAGEKRL